MPHEPWSVLQILPSPVPYKEIFGVLLSKPESEKGARRERKEGEKRARDGLEIASLLFSSTGSRS
jgi:hypothetical protein